MTTERSKEALMEKMDDAGREAMKELDKLEEQANLKPGIEAVREWWKGWYLKAGHKRLAKGLLGKLEY